MRFVRQHLFRGHVYEFVFRGIDPAADDKYFHIATFIYGRLYPNRAINEKKKKGDGGKYRCVISGDMLYFTVGVCRINAP